MEQSLKERTELFVRNRDIIKSNFKWDNSTLHPLCACLYTEQNMDVDANQINLAKEIIKRNTKLFSVYRSNVFLVYATLLSLEKNPENKFNKVLNAYESLKNEFWSSEYLPLSAFVMANMVEDSEHDPIVKKAKDIYQRMRKEHPFLTSGEDSGFAVMFALSDLTVDNAINEIERCYQQLKDNFFSKNAVQSLSHTLALGEEITLKKCKRVMDIFNGLKQKGSKFGTGVELSVLGVFAITTDDIYHIVNDIIEVNEYLLNSKGFGAFGTGRSQRMMYSAIIVMQEYSAHPKGNLMNMTSINAITNIIIAQQIAVSATIAASIAASSSND